MDRIHEFDNGDVCILREYFDADDDEQGIEVWDEADTECLCYVPMAEFLDEDDPDAAEWNPKELAYIQEVYYDQGYNKK